MEPPSGITDQATSSGGAPNGHPPTTRSMPRGFVALSGLLFALTAVAAGAGVFLEGVYRDNLLVRAGWFGNDLVTLAIALPLLAIATAGAQRGSPRAALVWCGVAAYTLYDYAFYAFGAAFNGLFLVYVGILVLSTFGLLLTLTSPLVQQAAREVAIGGRTRWVGVLVVAVSLGLGGFWVATSAGFAWTGEAPPMVAAVDHPTNVTGVLDLWLVVSFGLLGGAWLWQRRGWGYVIATVWSVKGLLYMPALSTAAVVQFVWGAADDLTQLALWLPIGAVCGVATWLLLRARPR
jgi:hypothetical protein